jgi:hypothetical protein
MVTEYEWDAAGGSEFERQSLNVQQVAAALIEFGRQERILRPHQVADHFNGYFPMGGSDRESVTRAERMIRAIRRKGPPEDTVAFPSTVLDGKTAFTIRPEDLMADTTRTR